MNSIELHTNDERVVKRLDKEFAVVCRTAKPSPLEDDRGTFVILDTRTVDQMRNKVRWLYDDMGVIA